jgi:hypothetical protein
MQILVLRMHRSGTSMVARLLNMMGAYFAPEGVEMPAHPENPKGFWARQDVLLCIRLLRSADCECYRISSFPVDKILNEALEECYTALLTQRKVRAHPTVKLSARRASK